MGMLNRLSIGAKIWVLVAVIFGLAALAITAGGLLSLRVQEAGLEAVHRAMVEGHESKLQSVVQSQTADLGKVFAGMATEEEKLSHMRQRFLNSWFRATLEEPGAAAEFSA